MEKSRRRKPNWQTAPDDLLIRVFSFLPARALLNVAQCCKNWYRVANDEFLWKDLFYRAWQIDPVIPRALGKSSWQGEFKRLAYHTPALESEVIKQHNDQVLHVSFAHNGSMFATSSKDGHIKVAFCLMLHALHVLHFAHSDDFVLVISFVMITAFLPELCPFTCQILLWCLSPCCPTKSDWLWVVDGHTHAVLAAS